MWSSSLKNYDPDEILSQEKSKLQHPIVKHLHHLFVALAFIGFIGGLLLTGSMLDILQIMPYGIASIILMCVGVIGDLMIEREEIYQGDEDNDF